MGFLTTQNDCKNPPKLLILWSENPVRISMARYGREGVSFFTDSVALLFITDPNSP
jgi:hypothetical protein